MNKEGVNVMSNAFYISKLRTTQKVMIFLTAIAIASLVFSRIFFGALGFYWALGVLQVVMTLIHFMVLVRTRNPVYLIPVFMYGFWALTFLPPLENIPGHNAIAIASAVFLAAFIVTLFSKKINWRYREILELAAKPVDDTADGFTSRPFPAGKADFNRRDVIGLARFLMKNVVVYPIIEKDRVVLVIPRYMWSYILFLRQRYDKETYVAFTYSGRINVCIAEMDYKAYKEELTFDQLCASLGDMFKQFLIWYKSGESKKIIGELNSTWRSEA